MAELIAAPTRIPVPGGKTIDEYVGRVNSGEEAVSVAHMRRARRLGRAGPDARSSTSTRWCSGNSAGGDGGRGPRPYAPGRPRVTRAGERVRYSTPEDEGAEYVAVCLPAFAPDLAQRD